MIVASLALLGCSSADGDPNVLGTNGLDTFDAPRRDAGAGGRPAPDGGASRADSGQDMQRSDGGRPPACGDGLCELGEGCSDCPADCGACITCGDGICDQKGGESCGSCAQDCGTCGTSCGNGVCGSGERCDSCEADCPYQDNVCAGNCNGSDGSDEAACRAMGNNNNCPDDIFTAWCTRRVNPELGLWDKSRHDWVANRCVGTVTLTGATFSCRDNTNCKKYECTTPLVLLFDPGTAVAYVDDDGRGSFDLSSGHDGSATSTDWPTAATPWLALDRDGDGRISGGRELFGSATPAFGGTAKNGFEALAALDDNGDGVIDAHDAAFAHLVVWTDRDGDRVSCPSELRPLRDLGVTRLGLAYRDGTRCDARGNCEIERGGFAWTDPSGRAHEGAVVDVHLPIHR